MYEKNKLGGWLLFLAVTKWLIIVTILITTLSLIVTYAGTGVDGELFKVLLCCLAICAAQFVQFRALKNKVFLSDSIMIKADLLKAFFITEAISCVAMCILYNIVLGTWISTLTSELAYIALWGSYLRKSKRVEAYI